MRDCGYVGVGAVTIEPAGLTKGGREPIGVEGVVTDSARWGMALGLRNNGWCRRESNLWTTQWVRRPLSTESNWVTKNWARKRQLKVWS
ncbi:hypothetical protein HMPREF9622_01895 [Cutibacterium modestum HL037PA3]|uniref:Uncharacterized protein n=1 Tax=Cutibacterium modestum HL044PA1 TaxID=765109 RepID=A0ABP2K7G8_9ACTN|nr:hypothetical protein HMPREF9607_00897 [Cutibacterium modestum HL044PA1]EFT15076.1 hypothetical protein HMPREF9622_01895 [Cutibacterium modestum HL037PA3]